MIILYIASCAALFLLCSMMILHPAYEDGLIGKLGLICIAVASVAGVVSGVDAKLIDIEAAAPGLIRSAIMIVFGIAVFMARHVRRFMQFSREKKQGEKPCNSRHTSASNSSVKAATRHDTASTTHPTMRQSRI